MRYLITENQVEKITFKWLNDNYGNIKGVESRYKISFIQDNQIVFVYFPISETVYFSYETVWSFLSSVLSLDNWTISPILTQWVREYYGLPVNSCWFKYDSILSSF